MGLVSGEWGSPYKLYWQKTGDRPTTRATAATRPRLSLTSLSGSPGSGWLPAGMRGPLFAHRTGPGRWPPDRLYTTGA
jgi:hypothetical protein